MFHKIIHNKLFPWLLLCLFLALMVCQLNYQGRYWLSKSGELRFWISDAWGPENSQQLFDPYSFSHLIHGLLFYGLLYLLLPRVSFAYRFLLSSIFEGSWEILENSSLIIDRYREATAALGYTGDTILNSCGDLISCGIGFFLADILKFNKTILLILAIELIMLITIRDSLLLNIIMLIQPVDFIRNWQMGHT